MKARKIKARTAITPFLKLGSATNQGFRPSFWWLENPDTSNGHQWGPTNLKLALRRKTPLGKIRKAWKIISQFVEPSRDVSNAGIITSSSHEEEIRSQNVRHRAIHRESFGHRRVSCAVVCPLGNRDRPTSRRKHPVDHPRQHKLRKQFPTCNVFLHACRDPGPHVGCIRKSDAELKPTTTTIRHENSTTQTSHVLVCHCISCGGHLDLLRGVHGQAKIRGPEQSHPSTKCMLGALTQSPIGVGRILDANPDAPGLDIEQLQIRLGFHKLVSHPNQFHTSVQAVVKVDHGGKQHQVIW